MAEAGAITAAQDAPTHLPVARLVSTTPLRIARDLALPRPRESAVGTDRANFGGPGWSAKPDFRRPVQKGIESYPR